MSSTSRVPNTVPSSEPGTLALPAGDRTLGPAVEFSTVEPNANIAVSVTPEPPADDAAEDEKPTFRLDVVENVPEEP